MKLIRRFRFTARRMRQTIGSFDNGWAVIRQIVTRSDELEYHVKGLRVIGPNVPGARVPVYEVFAEDEYSMEWFGRGLRPDAVLVDIGAHIGCFMLDFTRRHRDARVHAYEPTASTNSYLRRNVESNGLADRVSVHGEAVAAEPGKLVMADNGTGSGHNGVLHLGESGAVTIEVPCTSLAEVMDQAGGQVDLLKMDAEGAEYDIIVNSAPELLSGIDRLVMEYHAMPGRSFEELESRLLSSGLNLVRRDRYSPGLGLAWFSRRPID